MCAREYSFARWAVAHIFILDGYLLREEPPHVLRVAVGGRVVQLMTRIGHRTDVEAEVHANKLGWNAVDCRAIRMMMTR